VSDKASEERALRTIKVSGQSALDGVDDPSQQEQVRDRIDSLLADLEGTVIRDGANEEVLSDIEGSRRRLWERDDIGDAAQRD
jgi:hypothetical protein